MHQVSSVNNCAGVSDVSRTLAGPHRIAHHARMDDEAKTFDELVAAALLAWDVPVTSTELAQFWTHFQAVVETNRSLNLTRISDPREAAVKHYVDSLAILPWIRAENLTVNTLVDVGTGAGYPAIPLAIVRPDWVVTAIDATRKKTDFISRVARELKLKNVRVEHVHAKHWTSPERFDIVTLRAVVKLAQCIELGVRRLAHGGSVVAYKTASIDPQEQRDAQAAAAKSSLRVARPYTYELRVGDETMSRTLHIFTKT